ncbi:esterase-like activity of phytase family protein [Ancylobacter sp. VNQ12]|uniref:esterase-like activity of phytase family protein n=1 Tax=Ancylobacter sp. VNQ12 TaxID=3400920 RepID=UPI003C0E27D6
MLTDVSRSLLAATALLLALPLAGQAQTVALDIAATPIERFVPSGAARIGALEFRGGLVLSAASGDFGGWSGLVIDPDGAGILAVSDRGTWLAGRIDSEGDRPTGIAEARLAPMRAAGGGTLAGQRRGDVESLARVKGGLVVGIERVQEIWRFDGDDPLKATGRRLLADADIARRGSNEGPEALLAPPSGAPAALIVIAEESPDDPATLPGFLFGPLDKPVATGRFAIERIDEFAATDAALSDDGMVYLLERRYDMLRGPAMRIRRFPLSEIAPGARIRGEVLAEANRSAAIDNMEAIALHRNAAGELIITLLSDDNFSPLQRSLLLRFAVMQ